MFSEGKLVSKRYVWKTVTHHGNAQTEHLKRTPTNKTILNGRISEGSWGLRWRDGWINGQKISRPPLILMFHAIHRLAHLFFMTAMIRPSQNHLGHWCPVAAVSIVFAQHYTRTDDVYDNMVIKKRGNGVGWGGCV